MAARRPIFGRPYPKSNQVINVVNDTCMSLFETIGQTVHPGVRPQAFLACRGSHLESKMAEKKIVSRQFYLYEAKQNSDRSDLRRLSYRPKISGGKKRKEKGNPLKT